MTSLLRNIYRFGAGEKSANTRPFAALKTAFEKSETAVRFFYLVSTLIVYNSMAYSRRVVENAESIEYRWSVEWLAGTNLTVVADLFCLVAACATIIAFIQPRYLIPRIAFAFSLFMIASLNASFGGINHNYHAWLWIAVAFCFLPTGYDKRPDKLSFCTVFVTAQALVLLFYSMAGAWKVLYGLVSISQGMEGNFSPRGLALSLADRVMQTGTDPTFAPFVIENYYLAWLFFLGIIYVQLTSIMVAFRPQLHLFWGLFLVAFHTGTWYLMQIPFPRHVVMLMILLVASPFRPEKIDILEALRQLPIFGPLFRKIGTREISV